MILMSYSQYCWMTYAEEKQSFDQAVVMLIFDFSRIIIISLHVSLAYLLQMFANWSCIIHQTICYSFTLCFIFYELNTLKINAQNLLSLASGPKLMRDMTAFCQALCFRALKLSITCFCSIFWHHQSESAVREIMFKSTAFSSMKELAE